MSVLRYFITSKAKRSVLKLFLSHPDSALYTREVARLTAEPLNAVRRELGYLEKAGLLRSYMQGNLKYYQVVKTFPVLAEWQKIILFTPNIEQKTAATAEATASPTATPVLRQEEEAALDEEVIEEIEEEEMAEGAMLDTGNAPAAGKKPMEEEPGAEPASPTISSIVSILQNEFQQINSITLAVIHGEAAISETIPEDGIELLVVGDISSDDMLKLLADIEDRTGVPINAVRMTRSDFDYRNAKGDPLIRHIWSEKKLVVKGRH